MLGEDKETVLLILAHTLAYTCLYVFLAALCVGPRVMSVSTDFDSSCISLVNKLRVSNLKVTALCQYLATGPVD